MSNHPLSPPAWIFWLLGVLACVLFASTVDSLDWFTVTLVIGLMAVTGLICAAMLLAPVLGILDAWEEAKLAAASPPKSRAAEDERHEPVHQFSLKRMFLWMGAGAIVWSILSGPITQTSSLVLALGVMMGAALAIDGCAVAMDLSHDLLRAVLRHVACLIRQPPEDSR